ncbi:MAG: sulfatase [Solirubrobacterales bacterium]
MPRLRSLITLPLVLLVAFAAPAQATAAGEPPNVIVVVTDDQSVGAFNPAVMPITSRLVADRGANFIGAANATPLCCPSRASFLSGQFGHNDGVLWNAPGYRALREKSNTLPAWLKRAGYVTAHVGKYLNAYVYAQDDPGNVAPGWMQWHTFVDPNSYYAAPFAENGDFGHTGTRSRDYTTSVINRTATRMVRRYAPRKRPLFMVVDQFAPHRSGGPSLVDRCAAPGPEPALADAGAFADAVLPRPPSFDEPDVTDKPSFIRARPQLDAPHLAALERTYRCTLAALQSVDRGVGEIWDALGKAGERRNTALIFTSDNGLYFGEHRLSFEKIVPYRESLDVPLAMRLPASARPRPKRGIVVPDLVANVDLTATILDLAGADPCRKRGDCRTLDGRSLLGLAAGRTRGWPDDRALPLELDTGGRRADAYSSCTYQGMRSADEIFLHHTAVADGDGECGPADETERYDLTTDPYQLQNLAFSPTNPAAEALLRAKLEQRADSLSRCAGIKGRDHRTGDRPFCE